MGEHKMIINKDLKRKVTLEVKRRSNETIPVTLTRTVTLCGNSCHIRVPRNMAGMEVTITMNKKNKSTKEIEEEISDHTELDSVNN